MGALAATRSYRAADVERAQFTKRATPRGEISTQEHTCITSIVEPGVAVLTVPDNGTLSNFRRLAST